jgi:hypothetical protein
MLHSRGDTVDRAFRFFARHTAFGLIAAAFAVGASFSAGAEDATQGPRDILPGPASPDQATPAPAPAATTTAAPAESPQPQAQSQAAPGGQAQQPATTLDDLFQPAPSPGLPPGSALRKDAPPAVSSPQQAQLPSEQGVQVGQLNQVDAAAIGTLSTAQGGLGVDMWTGTDRQEIETLLPHVPAASTSAAARDLTRRLLLTAASIPSAGQNATPEDIQKSSIAILKARVDNLLAAGDLGSAAGLLSRVPAQVRDESLSRERADTALLTGNLQAACAEARDAARNTNDPYWLKLLAYCRQSSGDSGGAGLALDLLRDSGETDPVFQKLFDALPASGKAPDKPRTGIIKSLPNPAPLYLSMLTSINHQIPSDAVDNASPLVLQAIATAPNASPNLRAQAAEMAAATGSLPIADLIKAYGAEAFSEKEKSAAKSSPEDDGGIQVAGVLYQLALSETDPKMRADLLRAVWNAGQKVRAYEMVVKANLEATKGLPVTADLIGYAAEICRALLIGGDRDQALAWYNMARGAAGNQNIGAVRAVLDMWPLIQLSDIKRQLAWSPDVVDLWWRSQQVISAEDRVAKASVLFAALDGLDYSITNDQWQRLLAPPLASAGTETPSIAVSRELAAASKDRRTGETVMLALIALGKDPLKSASPAVLGNVVRALKSVGLEQEARNLALEVAVARGF